MSLIAYADDIFKTSRTIQSFERNFAILSKEYAKINLPFKREKTDTVLFNWGGIRAGFTINVDGAPVSPKSQMKYLELPIGDTLKATRRLLILHFQHRTATGIAWKLGSKQTSTQPQTASETLQCFYTPEFPIPCTFLAYVYDNRDEGASANLFPVCQIPACPSTMVKQLLGH